MLSLKIENATRKCNKKMQEVEGRAYLLRFKRKLRRKSVSIYNSVNSDKSAITKEKKHLFRNPTQCQCNLSFPKFQQG